MWIGIGSGVNLWFIQDNTFIQIEYNEDYNVGLLGSIVEDIYEIKNG